VEIECILMMMAGVQCASNGDDLESDELSAGVEAVIVVADTRRALVRAQCLHALYHLKKSNQFSKQFSRARDHSITQILVRGCRRQSHFLLQVIRLTTEKKCSELNFKFRGAYSPILTSSSSNEFSSQMR
jgi:hypothetical protein